MRSTARAGGIATAPTPPTARPGCGPAGRGRESSAPSSEGLSKGGGDDHSPEQIAGWLRLAYPDNEAMQVSHETIYRALYVQGRGALKRELTRHLRRGRSRRYARSQSSRKGKLTDMVMISERPPEVEDRAVPGHWEGDLLMGNRQSAAAIATLVERSRATCSSSPCPRAPRPSGSQMRLPSRSPPCRPSFAARSLGIRATRCQAPSLLGEEWRRGLRSPKPLAAGLKREHERPPSPVLPATSLEGITQERLDEVADKLNRRPRKTLGFHTPAQMLAGDSSTAARPPPSADCALALARQRSD